MSGNADAAWIRPAVAPPDSGRGVHRLEFLSVDAAYHTRSAMPDFRAAGGRRVRWLYVASASRVDPAKIRMLTVFVIGARHAGELADRVGRHRCDLVRGGVFRGGFGFGLSAALA
jgi:hypothetical protein